MSTVRHEVRSRAITNRSWEGSCSCGNWTSGALYPSQQKAEKVARSHVNACNENLAIKARLVGHTPQKVVQAAWALFGGHPDVGSIAWETGTTVVVVLTGDGGTVAIRYTLDATLNDYLTAERVRAIR